MIHIQLCSFLLLLFLLPSYYNLYLLGYITLQTKLSCLLFFSCTCKSLNSNHLLITTKLSIRDELNYSLSRIISCFFSTITNCTYRLFILFPTLSFKFPTMINLLVIISTDFNVNVNYTLQKW